MEQGVRGIYGSHDEGCARAYSNHSGSCKLAEWLRPFSEAAVARLRIQRFPWLSSESPREDAPLVPPTWSQNSSEGRDSPEFCHHRQEFLSCSRQCNAPTSSIRPVHILSCLQPLAESLQPARAPVQSPWCAVHKAWSEESVVPGPQCVVRAARSAVGDEFKPLSSDCPVSSDHDFLCSLANHG